MPPFHQPRAIQVMLQNRNRYLRLLAESLPEYSEQKLATSSSRLAEMRYNKNIGKKVDNEQEEKRSDNYKSNVGNNVNSIIPDAEFTYSNKTVNPLFTTNITDENRKCCVNDCVGVLANSHRSVLQRYHKIIGINDSWITSVNTAWQHACENIIPSSQIVDNDLFACALVHPSFISSDKMYNKQERVQMREQIAMPAELIASGSVTIQLLNEMANAHNVVVKRRLHQVDEKEIYSDYENRITNKATETRSERSEFNNSSISNTFENEGSVRSNNTNSSVTEKFTRLPEQHKHHLNKMRQTLHYAKAPTITSSDLIELPLLIGVNKYILFDTNAFVYQQRNNTRERNDVPDEVMLMAAVAICGAINLFGGMRSVAAFLDRVYKKQGERTRSIER